MKKIVFLLLLTFLNYPKLFATDEYGNKSKTVLSKITDDIFNCNLPAPENLVLTNVTTSSIDASWSSVPGAVSYLVEAYRVSDNLLLFSDTETGISKTLTGLLPATETRVEVSAICVNGVPSGNKVIKIETTDILIDIIVGNFECPSSINIIELDGFVNGEVDFEILDDGMFLGELYQTDANNNLVKNIFYFSCAWENGGYKGKIYPNNESNEELLGSLVSSELQETCNDCNYAQIVNETDDQFCKIRFNSTFTVKPHIIIEFHAPYIGNQYFFDIKKCGAGQKQRGGNMVLQNDNTKDSFYIYPNPFKDFFHIRDLSFGDYLLSNTIIEITNTDGKVVFSQTNSNSNASDFIVLKNTIGNGIYFLRLIHEDFVVTKTIVKSDN